VPWQEVSTMSLRLEFVSLAMQPGANIAELCRRFCISRKTGYKWLHRYGNGDMAALADTSRRPHRSPARVVRAVERAVLDLRDQHPNWGARKLIRRLADLGYCGLPSPSTGQAILRRGGRITSQQSAQHKAFTRFERAHPNSLWQMDFKGHVGLSDGSRCHPLTVLDDHARYNLALRACADERGHTVQEQLAALFRRYGLPDSIGVDNGPPWGDSYDQPYTALTLWLIRYGITVWHSRPYHPQTLGKDERFHRTLKLEVLSQHSFATLRAAQRAFDEWRTVYNFERPHDALGGSTPATRYRPSTRACPEQLPAIEYAPDCQVRKIDQNGKLWFHGHVIRLGKAFSGHPVGVRPTNQDGLWNVYFCHQKVHSIDLRDTNSVT